MSETVALTETLGALLQFSHKTEQEKKGLANSYQEQEERAKRKASHAIQAAQAQANQALETARAEFRQ